MYSTTLFEMAKAQMAERQQQSLAAYRALGQPGEQVQDGLRRLVAALRASIVDSLYYVRTTPEPLSVAVEPAGRQVIV